MIPTPRKGVIIIVQRFTVILATAFGLIFIAACSGTGSTPTSEPPLQDIATPVSTAVSSGASAATPTSSPAVTATVASTSTPSPTATTAATVAATATIRPDPRDTGDARFIQSLDPVDTPEHYCVDVPGSVGAVRLHDAMQAHTCKPVTRAEDMLFTMDHPGEGQIYMKAYDLCAAADHTGAGSRLYLVPCSDSDLQLFSFESPEPGVTGGLIVLEGGPDGDLCLAIADETGSPAGPVYLRIGLSLRPCGLVDPLRANWITP